MDARFDPRRVSEWQRTIAVTEDDEVDCDALMQAAESLIAAATRGDDVEPCCRTWRCTSITVRAAATGTTRSSRSIEVRRRHNCTILAVNSMRAGSESRPAA